MQTSLCATLNAMDDLRYECATIEWEALERSKYVGRIAPSPTGLLHLGHARTFWAANYRCGATKGTMWLRNEDLDPQRSKQEYVDAMRGDLQWLGITWDRELTQSERMEAYREAMQQLLASGHVFACNCSRKDLLQAIQAPHEDTDDEPIYNGRCRCNTTRTLEANTNYRFRVPDDERIAFVDGHCGPQSFLAGTTSEADFGDFLVWRKDGLPSYQLACVVDDAFQGVTEVVRGRDLLKSTARQILLQRALGLHTPRYFHTDLMRDANGVRLAKRHDALSLRALREQGHTPEQVLAMF
ncbi:tRNA glutamyl-Q(34) synthetase GluQRS [Granulicella cerasi]|uniref:tRNA glutamyl-Q(34) synthetase GluQRS n=1 Tax=Granulicella cerasi TaxID=741063 RepID=A0ABW1ZCC2_9BACT|nr:tRNA glutamyl-Q(34) synthetase GluQRS [Granulicella cerasi]